MAKQSLSYKGRVLELSVAGCPESMIDITVESDSFQGGTIRLRIPEREGRRLLGSEILWTVEL